MLNFLHGKRVVTVINRIAKGYTEEENKIIDDHIKKIDQTLLNKEQEIKQV